MKPHAKFQGINRSRWTLQIKRSERLPSFLSAESGWKKWPVFCPSFSLIDFGATDAMPPPIDHDLQKSNIRAAQKLSAPRPSSNVNVGLIDISDVVLRIHKTDASASAPSYLFFTEPSILQLQIPQSSNTIYKNHLIPTTIYLYNVSQYPREAMGAGY